MVEIGVPKSPAFDEFDLIVDAFRKSIGPAFQEVVEDLFEQRKQLQHQAQKQIETLALAKHIHEFCNRIQPTLNKLNFEQRRQLVELLID